MLLKQLISRQNADGGWGFGSGPSATEPTALAFLALAAAEGPRDACARAVNWLRSVQRADGSWPPMRQVDQGTWVTALALMLPPGVLGEDRYRAGVAWLLRLEGEETSLGYRLRQRLQGRIAPPDERWSGWPWYPGAAAWITPTATAVLALRRLRQHHDAEARVTEGIRFILARRCSDGGWNHGSARALGIEADSYPETTGIALLALKGLPQNQTEPSYETALRHLKGCRSAEANAWLRLALVSHGIDVPEAADLPCRNSRDTALQILADCAAQGRMVFP